MTTPIKIYDPLLCLLQRRAVQWMQRQERASEQVPDANWRYLQTQDGLSLWVATHTGDLTLQEPPMQRRCPGGLFCDEPVSFMSILKILYDTKTGRPPPGNAASLTHSRINMPLVCLRVVPMLCMLPDGCPGIGLHAASFCKMSWISIAGPGQDNYWPGADCEDPWPHASSAADG